MPRHWRQSTWLASTLQPQVSSSSCPGIQASSCPFTVQTSYTYPSTSLLSAKVQGPESPLFSSGVFEIPTDEGGPSALISFNSHPSLMSLCLMSEELSSWISLFYFCHFILPSVFWMRKDSTVWSSSRSVPAPKEDTEMFLYIYAWALIYSCSPNKP